MLCSLSSSIADAHGHAETSPALIGAITQKKKSKMSGKGVTNPRPHSTSVFPRTTEQRCVISAESHQTTDSSLT